MARRRLTLPAADDAPTPAPAPRRPAAPFGGAPIAAAAGEAARAGAEAARDARLLAQAEAEGRLLIDIPLDRIEAEHLARDRAPRAVEDEETEALVASLRAHGQRTPAEVLALGEGRYGLVSGWRRLGALRALHAQTGEPRFGVLRALVRGAGQGDGPPADAAAYVAMVEENEIRVGLSPYERGRIAVVAAERGAFESVEAAVDRLFAAASKAKRSKIRSFATLHSGLGDLLLHAPRISERLGLRLADLLREGGPAVRREMRAALADADPEREAEGELALLARAAEAAAARIGSWSEPAEEVSRAKRGGRPRREEVFSRALVPGLRLTGYAEGERVVFELSGPRAGEPEVREKARALLERLGD
ncbi:chromosome partitioning protein, ParB family [Albimonas donghaensis]|uniref:Chromosome partitioning protein, ParB family n=1 Tax=Albimonas donghaensis TaxID=356660 RepID=A0A1H3FR04_9RHOB|nr:ParB N-terminal domain-containing protein [Albimonas donghaensis]SDX92584.1 chromosome partitioning protein, ParB family [Albimonas donghaensis]